MLEAGIRSLIETALGTAVTGQTPLGGGRNSRVVRLDCADGRTVTAKLYHRHPGDPRDRQGVEFGALSFLHAHGVCEAPKPLFSDPKHGVALYAHCPGAPVREAGIEDATLAADFLARVNALRHEPDAVFQRASEACFSLQELKDNIDGRLARLVAACAAGHGREHEAAGRFASGPLEALHTRALSRAASLFGPDETLARSLRILSPSDFGFHNALRAPDGGLVFLDFEYFGWDDPAKTASDFMLHPGMNIAEECRRAFVDRLFRHLAEDQGLPRRLAALYPLYGVKWCLILLNEFIPASLARRGFAGATDQDAEPTRTLARQLQKAMDMLQHVENTYERIA